MRVAVSFGGLVTAFRRGAEMTHLTRVLAISAAFAALLTVGFHSSRDLTAFLRAAVSVSASYLPPSSSSMPGRVVRGEAREELRTLDPAANFLQTRVGQLLFSNYDTDVCRRVLFDNRSGTFIEAGSVFCGPVPEPAPDRIGQERAQQLLKSFRK
jgi:hypothetical protein